MKSGQLTNQDTFFCPKLSGLERFHCNCVYIRWFSQRLSSSETRPGLVKTLAVELRGEGTVVKTDAEGEERGRRAVLAHPDDLATSIRPYDGSYVM